MVGADFCIRRPELDFENFKAKTGRHRIHDYPAMLHYKVVEQLIREYGSGAKILYDPFCGSGVSLVEGLKQGKEVIGTDINPLALLIADVRLQNYRPAELKTALTEIKEAFATCSEVDVPRIKNINYWFKEEVIRDLGKLRSIIKNFTGKPFYNFLLVVFSQTARNVSNNRKGEFKRYRLRESELRKYNPNVLAEFGKLYLDYLEVFDSV